MAAGDKVLSSLATGWYDTLNGVINNYGPNKAGYVVTMNTTAKNIGAGAGEQVVWTGTAPENMTVTSVTANVKVSVGGSSSNYAPTVTFRVAGTIKATLAASSTVGNRTASGLSIAVTKGQTLTLVSAGYTTNNQNTTTFTSGSFTVNNTNVAQGNKIDATDINNLIAGYTALSSDPLIGDTSQLNTSTHATQTVNLFNNIPATVTAGNPVNWTGTADKANTTNTNISTVTCRNVATCTFSCSQTGSTAHAATGCTDYHAATGCTNYHAAYGCSNYHAAYSCWESCYVYGYIYVSGWCGLWNGYWNCYVNCYPFEGNYSAYHGAWGCSDYHAAWGSNNYKAAYGCTNYKAFYTSTGTLTIANCSNTTHIDVRCNNNVWSR